MIKVLTFNKNNFSKTEDVITPTIFPDGTSQVWKLPEYVLTAKYIKIIWNFETEREIIDLYSLKMLLRKDANIHLHIPYLPYARQDKQISNHNTFNLQILASLLNHIKFDHITSVDVHNNFTTENLINNFENINVDHIHDNLITKYKPDFVVFPDNGAYSRYSFSITNTPKITFLKKRNQETGEIIGFDDSIAVKKLILGSKLLIIDDICDGGATFVGVAKALREAQSNLHIALFVTHGIFSKGKNLEGIDEIFTTNSLPKNSTAHYQV